MNVLHVAAQGNQPRILFYFVKMKHMDVNAEDGLMSTPLHWAAISASLLSMIYLLAMKAEPNRQDAEGLTPLHLSIKASQINESTISIRQLL
jgi:ankyrin repeat protein